MTSPYRYFLVSLFGFFQLTGYGCFLLPAQPSSALVYMDNGRLTYVPFAMAGQSQALNTIPDFSYAGYQKGGVPLPDVPVQVTLSPGAGDMRATIQAAIDQVEALPPDSNGIRGAVLLRRGVYEVNGSLTIEAGGVVLRGEGQGAEGTVLFASLPQQHDFIQISGSGSGITEDAATRDVMVTPYVAVGTQQLTVANVQDFSVGDLISVKRTPNQLWIDTLEMGQYGWTPASYAIKHERVITAIEGDTLTVDVPIVDVMETQFGGGTVSRATVSGRISQCGVENLRVRSYYAAPDDEDHVWIAVRLSRVTNSWVKGVTAQYCGFACVSIEDESNFNTIQECAMIDQRSQIAGGRRYSFNISDGLGNLFQRCYTAEGRHDYVTGSRVAGPNVFLDCVATSTYSDIGPHHRWATGLLFDNIKGGMTRVQNRGSSGTGHGWAGAQTLFWNVSGTTIKVESPLGSRNWGIGCAGTSQEGNGYWEQWGNHVLPRSLYLQQLADRLGPEAVEQITIPAQLAGNIYELLEAWAGEGSLTDPAVSPPMYRIVAQEDAQVSAGSFANTNFGSDTSLMVNFSTVTVNATAESYLKFDLSVIPAAFDKASLRLWGIRRDGIFEHKIQRVSDDNWSESSITWNNRPSADGDLASFTSPPLGKWVEVDITEEVLAEAEGDNILSLRLQAGGTTLPVAYASREYPDSAFWPEIVFAPQLDTTLVSPVADAYALGGTFSVQNFGLEETLLVQGGGQEEAITYLKFDLSGYAAPLAQARLQVKVEDHAMAHPRQLLREVTDDNWTETGLTWGNRPALGDSLGASLAPAADNWLEFDLTAYIRTVWQNGDSTLSLGLQDASGGYPLSYHSRQALSPEDRPRLFLSTFSPNSLLLTSLDETDPFATARPHLAIYPNPTAGFAQIELTLPEATPVHLSVLDLQGRTVRVLAERPLAAGQHTLTWSGVDAAGHPLPAGMYLISVRTVQGELTNRLGLIR
ncbi:MAG: DNRLRE domain-containing protein [Bacteroidetes bacterium]|nr:MAG: DNRLRE domain-containing protein [Bacteroidota bacterium]